MIEADSVVEVPVLEEDELRPLPIGGPDGRIALVIDRLGLSQIAFARLLSTYGGGSKLRQETVNRWVNEAEFGQPRQTPSRENARALAELCSSEFGLRLDESWFYEEEESPLSLLLQAQHQQAEQIGRIEGLLGEIRRLLDHEAGP